LPFEERRASHAYDPRIHDDPQQATQYLPFWWRYTLSAVIAGHSRSKNGVLSHAYDPAIHGGDSAHHDRKGLCTWHFIMDARVKPAHDK
jgi:hypothetical protein